MGAHAQNTGRRRRARVVLVVEDDAGCRDEVCEALETAGYCALEAADGGQALEMLISDRTPEPELILLDLGLPVMTGEELMKVLRAYHRLARIPVILMSGNRSRPIWQPSDAGWLPKPFTDELLLEEVSKRCRHPEPHTPSGMTG
jgi:CheY-like chemotaxis protein